MESTHESSIAFPEINLLCDGILFKKLVHAGLIWLDQNHQMVNQLNVFPVPDGDTGTNMLLTMREAYAEIERSEETHVGKVATLVADGALNGARGNSGTILSQLWRGLADGLQGHGAFGAETFSAAYLQAVEKAYAAVSTPIEGTILTVARESSAAVVEAVADGERDLVFVLKHMLMSARASLRRTPQLLPVLKQAGVVDSGGQGLVCILEGMLHYLSGKALVSPAAEVVVAPVVDDWQQALEPEDSEGYGYDVQFRMHGANLDLEATRKAIEDMGWSACVVGSSKLIKVHVHVHDPGKPISYAIAQGVEIDDVVVENMQLQYQEFVRQREDREAHLEFDPNVVATIVVAPGNGLRRLFLEDLGAARVISGGQTMNPSTGDFLEAIRSLPNQEIVLLPNNKNIILAAQQAANAMPERRIRVVPSRTIPQGISAMLTLANMPMCHNADDAADEMKDSLHQVVSAEVTTATRTVEIGGVSVQEGQLIGLLEGNLVVAGDDMLDVLRDLLHKAHAQKRELVTLYYGSDTHKAKAEQLVEALAEDFPDLGFEIIFGGQSLYPYILSIE